MLRSSSLTELAAKHLQFVERDTGDSAKIPTINSNTLINMLRDIRELEVTTDSEEAIAAINEFAEQLLGYGDQAEVILKGVEADPNGGKSSEAVTSRHAAAEVLALRAFQKILIDLLTTLSLV